MCMSGHPISITLCANITLHPFDEYLTKALQPLDAAITTANFDNVWVEAGSASTDLVLIHNDILNLTSDLATRFWDEAYTKPLLDFLEHRLTRLRQELQRDNRPSVIATTLSATALASGTTSDNLAHFCQRYNKALTTVADHIIDFDLLLNKFGIDNSISWKGLYRFAAPYQYDFLQSFADEVANTVRQPFRRNNKVLVVDCDNTLWGGILGEDGVDGIKYDANSPKGSCFHEVQRLISQLSKVGILVAICSKNNEADVVAAFSRDDMPLTMDFFSSTKVNWLDKSDNIREIADELNLGLDSLVFLDDSDYEIANMRSRNPEVTSIQVPQDVFSYPNFFRQKILSLFSLSATTEEDLKRHEYYSTDKQRATIEKQFSSKSEFIKSLDLKLLIENETHDGIARVAQLTNKTNQFNLTTKRYSDEQIKAFIDAPDVAVISGSVSDRFGDSGKTILMLLRTIDQEVVEIDTFLMSCRVIGRDIELAFAHTIFAQLKNDGYKRVRSRYVATQKNAQVRNLYDSLGFNCEEANDTNREYILDLKRYSSPANNVIEVQYGR